MKKEGKLARTDVSGCDKDLRNTFKDGKTGLKRGVAENSGGRGGFIKEKGPSRLRTLRLNISTSTRVKEGG